MIATSPSWRRFFWSAKQLWRETCEAAEWTAEWVDGDK